MMIKWYFSESGKVSGPLTINDAKPLLSKGGDLYGWNSSLNHWLPVSNIPEFEEFLPENIEAEQVSKELIDKFVSKKKDLNKKITLIDNTIEKTTSQLVAFESAINSYKTLTENLTSEVQDNILPLEKKYNGIKKQLNDLEKAADIAKQEITDVVREFGDLVLSKTSGDDNDIEELNTAAKRNINKETSRVGEAIPSVQPVNNVVNKSAVGKKTPEAASDNIALVKNNTDTSLPKNVVEGSQKVEQKPTTQQENTMSQEDSSKKGFSDVKNKLKSVFGSKEQQPTVKLSDQLKMLEKEAASNVHQGKFTPDDTEDEELVYIDSDIPLENEELNGGEEKKRRRRRRR